MQTDMTVTIPSRARRRRAARVAMLAGGLAAVTLLTATSAEAAQRIHFKNGHVLVVESAREEGDIVYLRLVDGSEVGFPASLIAEVEKGPRIRAPRSTGSRNVSKSFRGPDVRAGKPGLGDALPKGVRKFGSADPSTAQENGGMPETVGYSKFGASTRNRRKGTRGVHIREFREKQRAGMGQTTKDQTKSSAGGLTGAIFGAPRLADKESKEEKTRR